MGVWGAGNLESDGTLDVVSERSGVLLGRLWSALQEQESWEADESLHDELFVDIEWAIALHGAGLLSVWDLVPPQQFDAAVAIWLAGWSVYFDGLSGPEFKAERRSAIEKSFAQLRGLFSTAQQQRGGPLQAGDVLSIPATGGSLFARVLQVLGPDCGLPIGGPLMAFAPALLLELWAQAPSETRFPEQCPVLVPGLLCDLDALESETWKVVGHKPVLPGELDYPMCISNETGGPTLCWGEISAPLDLPPGAVQAIGVFPTLVSSDNMAERALLEMGLEELVAEQDRTGLAMDKVDLRFSEDREALMKMAGLDVEKGYGEALAAWRAQQG
ncbi:MAG: hypothetical protein ACI9VR_004284 [Cognaticolwellia sp.]|jgi:hypothetical protein